MIVATSMMNSVWCEDELSQTVSDDFGSMEEGRMKGNIVSPTDEMVPRIPSFDHSRVVTSRPARSPRTVKIIPANPISGAMTIHGRCP